MGTRALLAFILTMCAVSGGIQAYSMQGVNSLLSQYGVPGSTITGLSTVNMTYSGGSYVALYSGAALYFLVNVTDANGYAFVLNQTAIFNVIRGHAVGDSLLHADFSALAAQMHAYEDSSASEINNCALETGVSTGNTCNASNACISCQEVPVCKKALSGTGGATGVMGTGIMTFERQYLLLNESLSAFYSAAKAANSSNAATELARVNTAFFNISNITRVMYQNSIFPPTPNITADVVSNCVYYLSSASAPWYCTALGFCENLDYNYTKLDYIRGLLDGINTLPISDGQTHEIAANASDNANRYVMPLVSKQQQARLAQLLNTTLPGYGRLVNDTGFLLGHVSNASLSLALVTLKANYANVTANYEKANMTLANRTLGAQYAALAKIYAKVNATYSSLTGQAKNNTEKLLELQLMGGASPDVANLAFQEFALNNALFSGGGLANLAPLRAETLSIAQRLSSYSTITVSLAEFARAADGPFIRAAASGLGMGYSEAVSLAPALGALLSLIIGAAVFALVLLYRSRMHRRHKVVLNHRTRRNWNLVLALLLALILLYALATYLLLSYASASAPIGLVRSALGSSNRLVIAINGTPTAGEYACANAIKAGLLAENRTSTVATFAGGLCNSENLTGSVDACMGYYAGMNVPVVVLTENATQGISAYSLYGTVLRMSGPAGVMDSCYVQYLLR